MSKLTLYGSIDGSRTWWVAWTCLELGLEYENVSLEFLGDDIGSDSYRVINPTALIPSVKDGDFVLWESMAINLYLAKKHRGEMSPESLEDEAQASQWSFWAVTRLENPLLTLRIGGMHADANSERGQYYLKHIPYWSAEELARCRSVIVKPFQVLNDLLGDQDFLLGQRFTIADLNVACIISRVEGADIDFVQTPHLHAWLRRCWSRPGCRRGERLLAALN